MKPPAHVDVGPFRYRIEVGGDAMTRALAEETTGLSGHVSHDRLEIALSTELCTGSQREVLLHEVLHACINLAGQTLDPDDEEAAVRVIAPALLGVLRDNAALVRYLTERV